MTYISRASKISKSVFVLEEEPVGNLILLESRMSWSTPSGWRNASICRRANTGPDPLAFSGLGKYSDSLAGSSTPSNTSSQGDATEGLDEVQNLGFR